MEVSASGFISSLGKFLNFLKLEFLLCKITVATSLVSLRGLNQIIMESLALCLVHVKFLTNVTYSITGFT